MGQRVRRGIRAKGKEGDGAKDVEEDGGNVHAGGLRKRCGGGCELRVWRGWEWVMVIQDCIKKQC